MKTMKFKRIFAFLLVLTLITTTLPLYANAETSGGYTEIYDIGKGSVSITEAGNYYIKGTNTLNPSGISISGNIIGDVNITVDNVNVRGGGMYDSALKIDGGTNVYLTLKNTNIMQGASYAAGVNVKAGASLTITEDSTGTLTATGHESSAGIGGRVNVNVGKITINGGIIIARGGENAAGIGSGFNHPSPHEEITINGGYVEAYGGGEGAGIGGGASERCGKINITGGTVIAKGGTTGGNIVDGVYRPIKYSSDIGSGQRCFSGSPGPVTVSGGSVNASRFEVSPSNGSTSVYLATIQGLPANKSVIYSVDGERKIPASTDADGKLYLWLPSTGSETVILASVEGTYYKSTGTVTTGTNIFTVAMTTMEIPVTGITLDKTLAFASISDETANINATISPSNATDKSIIWSSSDPGVATVNNMGVVTPLLGGVTTITATTADGGFKGSCTFSTTADSPTISSNLSDAAVSAGETTELSVTASVNANAGTLSYQWFSNTAPEYIGGTPIENAKTSSYKPQTSMGGTTYYYCTVENRYGDASASTPSNLAKVTVSVATAPIISSSPSGATVNQNVDLALSVGASTTSGTLSYQWYSNTTNSTEGATKITGATSPEYSSLTTSPGTTYYYCVVTSILGTSMEISTSDIAAVIVKEVFTYLASVNPTEKTFATTTAGYSQQPAQIFTIVNTGTGTITSLQAQLGGTDFEISTALSATSLNAEGTATISIQPKTGLPTGIHTDTMTITGSNGISLTINLSFMVNAAPTTKSTVPTQSMTVGSNASFTAADIAEDEDGDALTVTSIVTAPDSTQAIVSLNSGIVTITGVATGSTAIVVTVSDGNGGTVDVTVPIEVAAPAPSNHTPTAKSTVPTQSMTVGSNVSFIAADIAEDGDGDALTVTGIVTAPDSTQATASLNSGVVTITGVATCSTAVVVTVSDGNGGTVDVMVPIEVTAPVLSNHAPTTKSTVPLQSMTVGSNASFTAADIAEDGDGDALTVTGIVTAPDSTQATASLNSGVVTITGVATCSTAIVVTVSDGNGGIVDVTVPIEVTAPVPSNHAPIAKSTVPTQSMTVGSNASFTAADIAEDEDGDALTVTGIVTVPDSTYATASLNSGAVTITGVVAGSTAVVVTVSDGNGGTVDVMVPIEVTAPVLSNHAPTTKSTVPLQSMTVGSNASFTAADIAEDGDGDALTVTGIVTVPDSTYATASLNSGALTITGVVAGSTAVVVTVSDGNGGTVDVMVPIEVTAPVLSNHAPTTKSTVPTQSMTVGSNASFTAADIAEDEDGDALTVTGIVTVSDSTYATASLNSGALTITGEAAGSTAIVVRVSDGNGGTVDVTVPIEVTAAAVAPTITTNALANGVVGTAYSKTLTATGDSPITWSIASGNLPDGLTLDANTGRISGMPTKNGIFSFTVTAKNNEGDDTKALSIYISSASSGHDGGDSPTPDPEVPITPITTTSNVISFGSLTAGYTTPPIQTVTVKNTGNQSVTLTQPTSEHYVIGALSHSLLNKDETVTFTIQPKPGLVAGSYNESLSIAGTHGASASISLSFTVTEAPVTEEPVTVAYRGHIQNIGDYPLDGSWVKSPELIGTVGQSKRIEGFEIRLEDAVPAGMELRYNVHVENKGWLYDENNCTDWPKDGTYAGTRGEGLRIEAVKLVLTDKDGQPYPGYSVYYRGHVQNVGDLPTESAAWYTDGEKLGTVGSALRLEALLVKVVKNETDLAAYPALCELIKNQED